MKATNMKNVVKLFTALLLVVSVARAGEPTPRALEDFESGVVPDGWTASGGAIDVTGERFKHGGGSLRWTWDQPEASITWICPEAFRGVKLVENFNMWLYAEKAEQQLLWIEFLDAKNQPVKKCWWPINFRGWRPLGAPYPQVFGDLETLQRVVGIRFTAPEGMSHGKFYFDYMRTRSGGHVIWDFQHPWCFWEGRLTSPQAALELTLVGGWRLALDAPSGCVAEERHGTTLAKIPYNNFLPIHVTLEASVPATK